MTHASATGYPPRRQAWLACAILTAGCVLAYMDRAILSLFVAPIQRDLHLSDTEISLLIGFAFSLFNALFGLPVGRWIDSGNRTVIAATGIFVWSIANGLCGLANNFVQLFAARVGVGAGEAGVTPSAVSLLADYFPPDRRGAPVGIFYSGMYLGMGGVLLLGGWIWRQVGDRVVTWPVIGELHSWQAIVIGLSALGLIVGPLTLLMREPPRRNDMPEASEGDGPGSVAPVSLGEVLGFYRAHARIMIGHNGGFMLQVLTLHAGSAWLPAILMRGHGLSLVEAGLLYGAMTLALGPLGSIVAGVLADHRLLRGRADGRFVIAMGAALVTGAACILIGTSGSRAGMLAGLGLLSFFGTFVLPLGPGALQQIMPNAMRGQATAIYTFVINITAGALGATLVAVLTDYVFRDPLRVGQSFAIVGVVGSLSAFVTLAATRPGFRALAARGNPRPPSPAEFAGTAQ